MGVMLAVLVVLFLVVVAPVVIYLLCLRSLRRANRVNPRVPTFAPVTWLWWPERPARLHRRLRRATAMARAGAAVHAGAGGRGLPTIPEVVDDLEKRACGTDSRLVMAARATGATRWSMLNELEAEVAELEALATRLVGMTTAWATAAAAGQPSAGGTQAIAQRLDALEEAMREVGAISAGHSWPPAEPLPAMPQPYLRKLS
jgi:hypothetical protein